MKPHRIIAASAASALVFGGIIGSGIVLADDEDPPSTSDAPIISVSLAEGDPAEAYIQKLAENLGIDEETLRAALKDTTLDLVDQALAEGKLTEEQAERMREAIESGEGPLGFGLPFAFGHAMPIPADRIIGGEHFSVDGEGFGFGFSFGFAAGEAHINSSDLAEFLGISEEDLHAAVEGGQSLGEVAEANGKSLDELRNFIIGEQLAAIDQAVTDGDMTTEEGEDARARLNEFADHVMERGPLFRAPELKRFPGMGALPDGESGGTFFVPSRNRETESSGLTQ